MKRALLLALLLPLGANAALAHVQTLAAEDTGTTTFTTYPLTISTTAGNLLICTLRGGTDNTHTESVTDSASQTWTQSPDGYINTGGTNRASVFYKLNSAALTSITANFSPAQAKVVIICTEVSGADTAAGPDGNVKAATASATTTTTGAITTTNANDFLYVGVGFGSGVTAETAGTNFTVPTNAQKARASMEYRIVSATQSAVTTTMSWTTAATAGSDFLAFKQAAAGGAAAVPTRTLMGVGQ